MYKKKVFISFDFEHDRHYKYLLEALSANSAFDFSFDDKSSREINSSNISVVKNVLSRKINDAAYTLVIVGQYANSPHKNRNLIGYRNWQNYEIAKSKELKNKLVAVKINFAYESPEELLNSGASWAYSFTIDSIIKALA